MRAGGGGCAYCSQSQTESIDLDWILSCHCDEPNNSPLLWRWTVPAESANAVRLSEANAVVTFHPSLSSGVAFAKGDQVIDGGVQYWEVKAVSPMYGTDVMVGIGLAGIDLSPYSDEFCSALGLDSCAWALSYHGGLMHAGRQISSHLSPFKRGSIIGCLLDLWHRNLQFFIDGETSEFSQFAELPCGSYYPMLCSTAVRSGFRLIRTESFSVSLQLLCCRAIQNYTKAEKQYLASRFSSLPSGLKGLLLNQLPWSLYISQIDQKPVVPDSVKSHNVLLHPSAEDDDPFLWISFDDQDKGTTAEGGKILDFDDVLEDFIPPSEMECVDDNTIV